MGKISELPDDLLVKILSYLPTKVAISTSVLSKQWQFLWMLLSNLEFGRKDNLEPDLEGLQRFLLRNLPLHRAYVIESFRLGLINLDRFIDPEDVKLWVQFAVSRDVHKLEIYYSIGDEDHILDDILPSSLYTGKSLVTLKLYEDIAMVVPRMVCLPSLKTLRLEDVSYGNEYSLQQLLSNCPVLEDLFVSGFRGKLIVIVPSLQRLSLQINHTLDEFVIDTPSLEYLELHYGQYHLNTKNMPKLKEAFLKVTFSVLVKLIPSVKRLTLCLLFIRIQEVVCDDGFVFNKLKHLKLCTCKDYPTNVLFQLLKVFPNLRVLELFTMDRHCRHYQQHQWNRPSTVPECVPECILSSLETFKWSRYEGNKEEREIMIYILQNAHHLKTATIILSEDLDETLDIKKELELTSRASTTCQLLFH